MNNENSKKKKPDVLARLTMTHQDQTQTVIEVYATSTPNNFYHWYKRLAGKRNKTFLRTAHRNDARGGLQAIAERVKEQFERMSTPTPANRKASTWAGRRVTAIKIVVLKKKLYRRFLDCPTNELPGWVDAPKNLYSDTHYTSIGKARQYPYTGPQTGHTSMQRKMNILTGRR